jgi:hypothetical protein
MMLPGLKPVGQALLVKISKLYYMVSLVNLSGQTEELKEVEVETILDFSGGTLPKCLCRKLPGPK